jgi:hypothetical protein
MNEGVYEPAPGDIDESEPGSDTRGLEGVTEQLDEAETLLDRGVDDPLDEGYSPPDREPSVEVPTESEERLGESLDHRLATEVPDVGSAGVDDNNLFDEVGEEVGGARSGRLVEESDGVGDQEKDLFAEDVGIDGAAASAEEAAVHVIDPDDDEF